MKVKITPFNAAGSIFAPPSKSFAHRYVIAAFLSGKDCVIENVGLSDDVSATLAAVTSLGAIAKRRGGDIVVSGKRSILNATVDCAESGSTLRFLLPVAAALGVNAEFTGSDRLMSRPIDDLARAINGHGAKVVGHTVSGKLESGTYYLNASLSSQFISGMLFALSVVDGESEIILAGEKVSKGYIDITVSVLREFGVNIRETESGYKIVGGYNPPERVTVEGDWSGAAFPLAVGALTGQVTVKNLKYPTLQSDGAIVDLLQKFGAKVYVSNGEVTAAKGELSGVSDIDCENCPDIAQVICSVAAFAKGKTSLTGIERLKIKESDRIAAIINTLKTCGVKAVYDKKMLTVYGGAPKGCAFDGGNDHRTVMSAAVIASAANGVSTIDGAEHCAKSYPEFFEEIKRLGGNIDVDL